MENFIVSARKYRPVTFNEVVGQSAITNTLKNAIKNNHLAQAFLFTGPRGVGKTTCARVFAKTINCMNLTSEIEPCNECESCKSFNSSSSFNVHELDAASNNSVEDIRRLVEQVRIPPQVGQYKIYIIDEVHMLSTAAFNAFLKTLEEPPAYAKFILATTEKHKIIPTILSRCQIYDFNRITTSDISLHLNYVAEKEGITTEEEALHIIARKADGALRDALSIFDQMVSFCGNNITYESAIENLNVLHTEYYFSLIDHVLRGDISSTLLLYDEVISKGFEGHHFINGIAEHLRNLLVVKDPQTVQLLEVAENTKSRLLEQSKLCSLRFLIDALSIASQVDINYKLVIDKRIFMELNLMKLCDLSGNIPQNQPIAPPPVKQAANNPISTPAPAVQKKTEIEKVEVVSQPTPKPEAKLPVEKPEEKTEKPITETPEKVEFKKPLSSGLKKSGGYGLSIKADIENAQTELDKVIESVAEDTESYDTAVKIIDPVELKMAVIDYSEKIEEDEKAFSIALNANRITIKENNIVHLVFTNSTLDNSDLKMNLKQYLQERFENKQIQISTEIINEEVTHRDEPMENYLKMKEKNPVVEKIRSQLDLNF